MSTIYQQPGDYTIKKVQIESNNGSKVQIREMFTNIRIVEDINNPFITAEMTLEDRVGLYKNLPIVGEETVTFKYTVDNSRTITRTFLVYRMGEISYINEAATTYKLYMISPEALADENTKISRSYKQQSVDQIAQDAFSELESEKSLTVDPVEGMQHIIVPRWSPMMTINWLTRYAVDPSHTENMFVLYENVDGFQFKNIPTLLEQQVVAELLPKVNKSEPNSGEERWPGRKIIQYQVNNTPDKLTGLRDGRYASHVTSVDNLTKNQQTVDTVASEQDITLLNSAHAFSSNWSYDDPDQRFHVVATKQHRTDSGHYRNNAPNDLAAINFQETVRWHSMIFSLLGSTTVQVTMYGTTDVTAGITLRAKLPERSSLTQSKAQKKDPYTSAKYLVTRCEHIMSDDYQVRAKLETNSYPQELQSQDV